MANILIVEDDVDLACLVCDRLEAENHQVEMVHRGDKAQQLLQNAVFDLMLIDWELPGLSGPEICKGLREAGGQTLILMLTGKKDMSDKEVGFESGVDDYLSKPFDIKELMMRVRALLRRQSAGTNAQIKSLSQNDALSAGKLIDNKYLLAEQIAQGGMGVVYKARHLAMDRDVVVKTMQFNLSQDDVALKRFEQEQKLLAKINHPNIIAAYDVGMLSEKMPYIVMEYVEGETLAELIKRKGRLPLQVAASILILVCQGLQYVHELNIVHRDLKPENILILSDDKRVDWVKVLDFGTAYLRASAPRLTAADAFVGTAEFIAPEQLKDLPIDGRADIYALGVTFYYMLSGELPFSAATPEALLLKALTEAPRPLSSSCDDIAAGSPAELIVDKALNKEPSQRFQSAGEMRLALESLLL